MPNVLTVLGFTRRLALGVLIDRQVLRVARYTPLTRSVEPFEVVHIRTRRQPLPDSEAIME